MIINKSDKIDYDKYVDEETQEELSDKAKAVLKCVIDLKNNGVENITNSMVSEATELTPRQVVGVTNGIVKKGLLKRGKAEVQVVQEVTVFLFPGEE